MSKSNEWTSTNLVLRLSCALLKTQVLFGEVPEWLQVVEDLQFGGAHVELTPEVVDGLEDWFFDDEAQ